MDEKTYTNLLKLFYANIHDYKENDLTFKSWVRKKSITVFPNLIAKVFKIPRLVIHENSIVFPYATKEQFFAMATVIVDPKGHIAQTGYDRAQLLLGKGMCIDLLFYIFNYIGETSKENDLTFKSWVRKKSITVFPNLIAKVFKIPRLVIHENSIVFPYATKEQFFAMATVIVDPKGHIAQTGYDRAQLLLGKGMCIDLLFYIFNYIGETSKAQHLKQPSAESQVVGG
ncbi:unnamed protein product [Ilex paraguariensis]|uniref:Uncharacterized protein n=1 Tax=Ilex paraguariensis TaxID=185542 RepID=A0ABC8RAN7_9AQUA